MVEAMKRIVLVVIALGSTLANANLIANGSFELGTLPSSGSFVTVGVGSVEMPNWTISQASVAWANGTAFGVPPSAGLGHIDLFGFHDSVPSGKVSQSIATVIGQSYDVQFDVGTYNGLVPQVRVAAGSQFADFTNPDGGFTWKTMSWSFVATSASTLMSFEGGPLSSPIHAGLDNISVVEAVPEPASLMAIGAGLLALVRRRKA